MFLNQVFTFKMGVSEKKFQEILSKKKRCGYDEELQEYTDESLVEKGIIIKYRDSQYKKKVTVIFNMNWKQISELVDANEVVYKFNKVIRKYFKDKYSLRDFRLSEVVLVTDIKLGKQQLVGEYLKVIKRIGKVKKFEVSELERLDKNKCFCLKGKSNGIQFMIYSLESVDKRINKDDWKRKYRRDDISDILRIEVNLNRTKAVNSYTEESETFESMKELLLDGDKIFLEIMNHIIPYGDYYKKEKAMEKICSEVKNKALKRKMLRLVTLIPEKKSLYLAQRSMSCSRDMDKIMEEFAKINVSPVTLSKRQNVLYLENFYKYML